MTDRIRGGALEIRASGSGETLRGVLLEEGRAATGGRAEVFAPGASRWDALGLPITIEHAGEPVGRVHATRDGHRVEVRGVATPAIRAALESGITGLSVEFHALHETMTRGGVREIADALIVGASLTRAPEYAQGRAELRSRRSRWWLTWL